MLRSQLGAILLRKQFPNSEIQNFGSHVILQGWGVVSLFSEVEQN